MNIRLMPTKKVLQMMKKINLLIMFLSISSVVYAQKYRTEKQPMPTGSGLVKVIQYYDNGQIYRKFYEREGKRDSLYLRWDKKSRLVREGFYASGKKTKLWKQWFYKQRIGYDYCEELYSLSGHLQQISYYWIRNKKNILLNKIEHLNKKDTTIQKISDWYGSRPGQLMNINKLTKVNGKFISEESKTWAKEGWLFTETLYTEEGKNTIVFEREWNEYKQKVKETWTKTWKVIRSDGYSLKQKLFRRKTYKDGKLIKDEKFE